MKYDVLIVIRGNSKEYNVGEVFNESMSLNDNYIKRDFLVIFSISLKHFQKSNETRFF